MAHPLELAEPNVIDEDLIRNCITTVEEMSLPDEKKKEMKTETELHDIKVIQPNPTIHHSSLLAFLSLTVTHISSTGSFFSSDDSRRSVQIHNSRINSG